MKTNSNVVSIVRSDYENAYEKIARAVNLCGGLKKKDSEKIIIKINLCDFRTPETGAITHPAFLDAFLRYLRENYGDIEIVVVESDATVARPDLFVEWFGFNCVFRKWNVKWRNLSKDEIVKKPINGLFFKEFPLPKILDDCFFVSMAKMKTSSVTKMTCALKNQFGCIPFKRKVIYHSHLDDIIVDSNLAVEPDFCVVDGVIGMGGAQAPAFGVPIYARTIVVGKDPVAVDAVCAKIMGFDPNSIGHIKKATAAGVGSMQNEVVGEKIDDVRTNFEWDPAEALVLKLGGQIRSRFRR